MGALMVDVGQPLRSWFTFWVRTLLRAHPVTFCISCYLTVLVIEYLPIVLRNTQAPRRTRFPVFEFEAAGWYMYSPKWAFSPSSTRLARLWVSADGPSPPRRHLCALRFFLFILSAAAVGPSFIILTTSLVEKITGKRLVKQRAFDLLGRISGLLLAVYVLAKTVDTLIWINRTSPAHGFLASQYYDWKPFGTWILFAEIVVCGLIPALILLTPRMRARRGWLVGAAALACGGVTLNRLVQTLQTLALPTLSFDKFLSYTPSWQETGTFLAVVAYGVLVYSFSYRYFQIFPEERELKAAPAIEPLIEEPAGVAGRY